jgi:hypothetical protein
MSMGRRGSISAACGENAAAVVRNMSGGERRNSVAGQEVTP